MLSGLTHKSRDRRFESDRAHILIFVKGFDYFRKEKHLKKQYHKIDMFIPYAVHDSLSVLHDSSIVRSASRAVAYNWDAAASAALCAVGMYVAAHLENQTAAYIAGCIGIAAGVIVPYFKRLPRQEKDAQSVRNMFVGMGGSLAVFAGMHPEHAFFIASGSALSTSGGLAIGGTPPRLEDMI